MADNQSRVWVGSMPDAYERLLVPTVFLPFAVDLARRVAAHGPRRVLELAAGTGVVTDQLLAAMPSAEVVATDLNPAMVALGSGRVPQATWRQADALNLPFEDAQFDVVACQFGVMFFPDKPAAFAEARRVLTEEGTVLVSTWGTVDTHDFAAALQAALERVFPGDAPGFIAGVPHGYADLDAMTADVAAGGLRVTSAETIVLEGRAESAAAVATGFCTGTPLRGEIEARADLATATAAITAELASLLGTGPVTGRMTAHVIEAAAAR